MKGQLLPENWIRIAELVIDISLFFELQSAARRDEIP
ncbi:MAG: hypothetical protein ACI9JM_000446 [Halioglobus sp.]|jgi:hypothetical protein